MAAATAAAAVTRPAAPKWSVDFDTARRERLFKNPPKDKSAFPMLQQAILPHTHSFNDYFGQDGYLVDALRDIGTKTFLDGNPDEPAELRNRIEVRFQEVMIDKPALPASNKFTSKREILPSECRERHATYRGKLRARLSYRINEGSWFDCVRELGNVPVMVRSNKCHLDGMSPAQLVVAKEESEELGGFFIVNGNEKLVRLLIVARRNYPLAIVRPSFTNRGRAYTPYGIQIRSVRPDQSSMSNVLHYLDDGNVTFRFSWRKSEYLVPVMMVLHALVETNDRDVFERLVGAADAAALEGRQFVLDRAELLIRTYRRYGLVGKAKARAYLGEKFRPVMFLSPDVSDYDVGTYFLRKIVLPHLGNVDVSDDQDKDKFNMLLFMVRKLYALVEGECAPDNPDAVSMQEILLGGFLYGVFLKERLEEWLNSWKLAIDMWSKAENFTPFTDPTFTRDLTSKILRKTNENLAGSLEYFLSTGNLSSPTGLDLQQASGFTIVAEKINFYRFISHFRMVHRGSFFAELKTTTVRKLLPESWGFLCPVHTPDGSPCGLLNHLSHTCVVSTRKANVSTLPAIVAEFAVRPDSTSSLDESVVVQLDGRVLGYCSPGQAQQLHEAVRMWKVTGKRGIDRSIEIGYVPNTTGGQYPGVYMFSEPARMMRPVKHVETGQMDFVGPFEQPYMTIAVTEPEVLVQSTHVEYDPTNILSIVANMTPFSDFNQSPRNMYQCQMGKQTMGTPGTAISHRTDNKMYRLQTAQTPVVRSPLHHEYGLDNFPNGTNCVVAVISYTGYDMDDAMIINKSAHERGFAHGTVYKTKVLSLADESGRGTKAVPKLFGFAPGGAVKKYWSTTLDMDGLPQIGALVREGDPLIACHTVSLDPVTGEYSNKDGVTEIVKYKDSEDAFVDDVRLIGAESGSEVLQKVSIKLRIPRSPVIGDKFSSRHGQKGVCSQKWPMVDMPFTESGMQPDVIINPHAFPSRMTIGMFVESMAGKAGVLHGMAQDGTPFRFDEEDRAVDFFGEQLRAAGYNYYGNEPMYSGITGRELAADIYVGVVYYQRLRHMVNDKYQVRTTGINNPLTGQPIKGRQKGGGIRVGEMERDSLLAHGTAFLLQDRLFNCSDYAKAWICRTCGGFLGVVPPINRFGNRGSGSAGSGRAAKCRRCASKVGTSVMSSTRARRIGLDGNQSTVESGDVTVAKANVWEDGAGNIWSGGENVAMVAVPGVLRFLDVELAAMGIQMRFKVGP